MRRPLATLAALAALAFFTVDAAAGPTAEEKKACSQAAEKAQRLRNDGKLRDAREQLVVCARNVCPAIVRKDCEPWLSDVENRLPSVVIVAKDGKGKDVVDVRVVIDGQPVADHLDGKAVPVDPGVHSFHYEHAGSPAVDDKLVIREGERDRVVEVTFVDPAAASANAGGDARANAAAPRDTGTTVRTETGGPPLGAFGVAGLGVAALGAFAYFHFSAKSDIDDMRATCAPRCDQSRVDDANTKIIVSDVALGAGVVALGIATWLFFARPTKVVEVRSAGLRVHF